MLRNARDAAIGLSASPGGHRGQAQQRWHLTTLGGWRSRTEIPGLRIGRAVQQALRKDCYLWRTRSWPVATSRRTTSAVSSADIADESITCFS